MSSPLIPYSAVDLEVITSHLASLERKKSSNFWEHRRLEQRLVPQPSLNLIGIEGLYKSNIVKPPLFAIFKRPHTKPYAFWSIRFKLRHSLHRVYRKKLKKNVPEILRHHFSEYDLAKSEYVFSIIREFQIAPIRILEIGGGVGLVGHAILQRFPNSKYFNVDLNEMLPSAAIVARALHPDNALNCIHNGFGVGNSFYCHNVSLPTGFFDLGINVTSFQEMDQKQINDYMQYLDEVLQPGGYFISINRDVKINEDLKLSFVHDDVSWPKSFTQIHSEQALISQYSGRKIKISAKIFKVSP